MITRSFFFFTFFEHQEIVLQQVQECDWCNHPTDPTNHSQVSAQL